MTANILSLVAEGCMRASTFILTHITTVTILCQQVLKSHVDRKGDYLLVHNLRFQYLLIIGWS